MPTLTASLALYEFATLRRDQGFALRYVGCSDPDYRDVVLCDALGALDLFDAPWRAPDGLSSATARP